MPRRTYGEDRRNPEERRIRDRKVVEAFITQLEGEEEAKNASELLESADSVEAEATYRLDHPYEGENFWRYSIPRNEEVSAWVELEVVVDGEEMIYQGRVYDNAYDIFNPPQPDAAPDETVEADVDISESGIEVQDETSGPATVETD